MIAITLKFLIPIMLSTDARSKACYFSLSGNSLKTIIKSGTTMIIWGVQFQINRASKIFPSPRQMELEERDDASYYCEGRGRRGGFALLVSTLGGRGSLIVDGVEHELTRGVSFLCQSNDPRVVWCYPKEAIAPWRFLWLSFQGEISVNMVTEMVERYGYLYQTPLDGPVMRNLLGFQRYRNSIQEMSAMAGAEMIFQILTGLRGGDENRLADSSKHDLSREAQRIIMEDIDSGVSVESVARRLRVSREHFSRVFKKDVACSPTEYINRQKILYAGRLLQDSHLSCKEIAARLNYENSANFSRAFKKLSGFSPREYRRSGALALI